MAVDDLVTQGAGASAAMVFSQNIPFWSPALLNENVLAWNSLVCPTFCVIIRACYPSGYYWDYPGTLSVSQVIATHFKIGYLWISC